MIWQVFYWVFGVGTCAFYAFETLHICAQTSGMLALFWPLLIIPVANAAVLLAGKKQLGKCSRNILGTLNGIACIVATLLALVLSPLCMLAGVMLMVSLALIWTPACFIFVICAYYLSVALGPMITAWMMRRRLNRLPVDGARAPMLPLTSCLAAVLSCVLIAVFPTVLTKQAFEVAESDESMPQALLLLRAFGDNDTMLRKCYSQHLELPWYFQEARMMFSDVAWGNDHKRDVARELYYRVKGKPFNSVKRPLGVGDYDDDYYSYLDWQDHDFAGTTVGGIVRGLRLSRSHMDGWVGPDEGVAHINWLMHFAHDDGCLAELRAQLLLPPKAVVSNCSLWVNGQRRDAIIGTRASTRHAYQTSAQAGEKPFMVATAGSGRVLMQSSTGWWGRDVDLMLEITAPLSVLSDRKAAMHLPMFAERNFDITSPHQINLASSDAVEAFPPLKVSPGSSFSGISGALTETQLQSPAATLQFARSADKTAFAVPPSDLCDQPLVERITSETLAPNTPLIVVIDGSNSMQSAIGDVIAALNAADSKDATIIWAADRPVVLASHVATSSSAWHAVLAKLQDCSFLGGQNNAEALAQAVAELPVQQSANVLWVHGPQPVKFTAGNLAPILRHHDGVRLWEYQPVAGPNEVIKALDLSDALRQVPYLFGAAADLRMIVEQLCGRAQLWSIQRTAQDNADPSLPAAKHNREIAQLYFEQVVADKLANLAERPHWGAYAQAAHIVTPLTSALVLERDDLYARYGVKQYAKPAPQAPPAAKANGAFTALDQATGGLIPTKPEPPLSLLLAVATLILGGVLWIQRRRRAHA
jgi:hypothetical protein